MQKSNIGEKIRQYREMRMVSREDLALNSNLDKEQLRIIEDEGVVPSWAR